MSEEKAQAMVAAFRPFTYLELLQKYGRAEIGIDGNAGFALLGGDLQEGEVEFVTVEQQGDELLSVAEQRAAKQALAKLRERLGMSNLSFYHGTSYPGACQ